MTHHFMQHTQNLHSGVVACRCQLTPGEGLNHLTSPAGVLLQDIVVEHFKRQQLLQLFMWQVPELIAVGYTRTVKFWYLVVYRP